MPNKIIDTHVHIWNFDKAEYEWLKNDTSILNRSYNIDELAEEHVKAGVTEGVLVQAANNFEDTDWMLQVATQTDWITGVVGWLPLMNPEAISKALEDKYIGNKYFKGVRHLIHDEPNAKWLIQPEVIESLKILAALDIPYDVVGILTTHIETSLQVAEKVPDLRMIFDHLNQPPISTKEKFGRWGELMSEAAKNKNFCVKISGLGTCSRKEDWTADDIKPYIEFAFDKFGVERSICGGDWPVSLLSTDYTTTWNIYKEAINSLLDKDDADKVFYKNAQKFYDLS
jgi:L-fuconolactonase